jgi:hypothetical protein
VRSTARLKAAPFQDSALWHGCKAVPFPIKVKVGVNVNTKIKSDRQECPSHTVGPGPVRQTHKPRSLALLGMTICFRLREFDAVGFAEVVPGFAVGVVDAGDAAADGAEHQADLAEDMRKWEDEPGVFGDDIGGDEIDFGESVRDDASVEAAARVDAIEAVDELRGGFDLHADEARASTERRVVRAKRVFLAGAVRREVVFQRIVYKGIEDDVVAFAVAEGFGDTEAVAGGGESESEFRNLSAALGSEFALEGSLRA